MPTYGFGSGVGTGPAGVGIRMMCVSSPTSGSRCLAAIVMVAALRGTCSSRVLRGGRRSRRAPVLTAEKCDHLDVDALFGSVLGPRCDAHQAVSQIGQIGGLACLLVHPLSVSEALDAHLPGRLDGSRLFV